MSSEVGIGGAIGTRPVSRCPAKLYRAPGLEDTLSGVPARRRGMYASRPSSRA